MHEWPELGSFTAASKGTSSVAPSSSNHTASYMFFDIIAIWGPRAPDQCCLAQILECARQDTANSLPFGSSSVWFPLDQSNFE